MILNDICKKYGVSVFFTYDNNPCLHIHDSYLVKRKKDIKSCLDYIHNTDEYRELVKRGYKRTYKSEYHEWAGHNTLYRFGYIRSQTGSVDIDNHEPRWRRILYAILSIF